MRESAYFECSCIQECKDFSRAKVSTVQSTCEPFNNTVIMSLSASFWTLETVGYGALKLPCAYINSYNYKDMHSDDAINYIAIQIRQVTGKL